MIPSAVTNLSYLVAACLFIFGLKQLSSPRTAARGNSLAALGMLIAIVVTLLDQDVLNFGFIIAGLVVGGLIGIVAAQTIRMTAMPQMVALFNGLGGAASALVAASDILYAAGQSKEGLEVGYPVDQAVAAALSILIGAVTFTGSVIAFAKLQELIHGRPVVYAFQKTINALLLLVTVALAVAIVVEPFSLGFTIGLFVLASVLGVLSVIPIGGADMPVVISLLNSYSGLAACATGFVLKNNALIISGSLVGASGIILTQIMCKAMNRSLANVLFGAFGQVDEGAVAAAAAAAAGSAPGAAVKSGSPEDAAMVLDSANLVVFVPGYGMAVAQAQHAVRELADLLEARGATVKYGVHPVAGRMPGHMNVLLAEADVPYDQLCDMDEINPQLSETDVAMVIGANDVTNPAARTNPASPIYGMPILDVDKARTVMVLKRSLNPGFAGIDNELFTRDNTMMVFGDAKDTLLRIATALKDL